jgi:hypothetical protein
MKELLLEITSLPLAVDCPVELYAPARFTHLVHGELIRTEFNWTTVVAEVWRDSKVSVDRNISATTHATVWWRGGGSINWKE